MKNCLRSHLLILLVLTGINVKAQKPNNVIRQAACFDSTIKVQLDSLKQVMASQGFIVVKAASMAMESEYEMPVIVPLTEGTWYHIAFIGDMTSKLYEVRMYDWQEKQVVYQKHFGQGMESNIISYSYIPKFSEYHMIKPLQINKQKKKNICGYIILFKKLVS
jgi:hypothetical protein